jgi:hypothetical protein
MTMIFNFLFGLMLNFQCDTSCWHSSRKGKVSFLDFPRKSWPNASYSLWVIRQNIFWLSKVFSGRLLMEFPINMIKLLWLVSRVVSQDICWIGMKRSIFEGAEVRVLSPFAGKLLKIHKNQRKFAPS